ncbi:hypothetical protein [Thaumasiovibrio sp. DFM-14]|uniref:hypothetical protein n=1 Tax=Thaumasiovibrio sp. DFM-14 TaxID=3384792 RepID=UPI0039A18D66
MSDYIPDTLDEDLAALNRLSSAYANDFKRKNAPKAGFPIPPKTLIIVLGEGVFNCVGSQKRSIKLKLNHSLTKQAGSNPDLAVKRLVDNQQVFSIQGYDFRLYRSKRNAIYLRPIGPSVE